MGPKDYFSDHSKIYAAFRPTYPPELYNFIFENLAGRDTAWDCATGNGQAARELAKHFKTVYATDISPQQLDQAEKAPNIIYRISRAEETTFQDHQFDLITVGQALHWFEVESFYREVKRTGKDRALIAVWGYALLTISPELDRHFLRFYHETVGRYWDYSRKLVETEYKSIAFPFEMIPAPTFRIVVQWTIEQFGGYLRSWSATEKFIKENGHNPVPELLETIAGLWPEDEIRTVTFPLFLKLGRIHTQP